MRKVAIGALVALTWLLVGMTTNSSQAATLRFGGSVGYSYSGSYATLTADHIYNYTTSGYSNNIRMELWVFPAPYTGTQSGYKVAQYQLGQLQGGYEYYSINSGAVPFSYPPNGTWYPSMFLMEYDGTANTNNGFTTRDWVNLSPALQIGAVVTPGQLAVPSSYAFGAQTAGTSGPAQALTMTNIGGAAVTILGISSSLPVEFNVNWGNCPTSLNPGASCTFYVTFRPAQIGSKSAVITVQDSGINSPHYVSLSGTGTAPAPPPGQLSVQGAVAYGNQTVGTTSGSTTLTVTNTGGTAVSVSAIWPAAGFVDTLLRWSAKPEVVHEGKAAVHTRV